MTMESLEELRNRLLREERVQQMVKMRAYEIYQMRGGQPGWEAHDWFQAETEVLTFLIALESGLEDEKTGAEALPAVSALEAPPVSKAPVIAEAAPGKARATKQPKSRSASKVTTAKPAKKTAPKGAVSKKSESRAKVNRTRKPSKEEKSDQ
jgi:type IV secretory pathway VirB10-like protein